MNKKAQVEGLLFVSGDEGITIDKIAEILEIPSKEVETLLKELEDDCENRGITVTFLGNKYKLTTKKEDKEIYQKLIEDEFSNVLSQAALETLAIIAYNEPVTRLYVDNIRGVQSSNMIRKLLLKGFVEEVGRSTDPGRPYLYKTTNEFLDYFGLKTIEGLPSIEEFIENNEEEDLFKNKIDEEIEVLM